MNINVSPLQSKLSENCSISSRKACSIADLYGLCPENFTSFRYSFEDILSLRFILASCWKDSLFENMWSKVHTDISTYIHSIRTESFKPLSLEHFRRVTSVVTLRNFMKGMEWVGGGYLLDKGNSGFNLPVLYITYNEYTFILGKRLRKEKCFIFDPIYCNLNLVFNILNCLSDSYEYIRGSFNSFSSSGADWPIPCLCEKSHDRFQSVKR
jgi:hypothetical protein